ncbi:MAG: hypothetical protein EOO29_18465 [Comamonadaceae bacterium]|nr:MAG: hypothetical protein EOO29_18465 [Comamonadaceae bacterium]
MGWLAPHSAWQLVTGFTLWAIWFVAVYGGLSVACAVAPPASARGPLTSVTLALLALTLGTVLALLLAARYCWRALRRMRAGSEATGDDEEECGRAQHRQFVAGLAAWLHLAAAVATVFVGLPLLWLPPCL